MYSWTLKQTGLLFVCMLLTGAIVTGIVALIEPPADRIRSIMVGWIFVLLAFVAARFDNVGRLFSKAFSSYLKFAAMTFLALVPGYGFFFLLRMLLATRYLWAQLIVFTVWGVLLTAAVLLIATKSNRDVVLRKLGKFGVGMPIAYSLMVLILALEFFSSVTFVLSDSGIVTLIHPCDCEEAITTGRVTDFFLWHFLESIPVLKVNETIKWTAPLIYYSAGVGWIVLLFKAGVTLPVIAAFTWYWKQDKTEKG